MRIQLIIQPDFPADQRTGSRGGRSGQDLPEKTADSGRGKAEKHQDDQAQGPQETHRRRDGPADGAVFLRAVGMPCFMDEVSG